jgi:beta-glucosidase
MFKTWTGVVALAALASRFIAGASPAADDAYEAKAQEIVSSFTVEQVLGQMTQIDISAIINSDYSLNEDAVRSYAKQYVGSYLNSPFGGLVNGEYLWTVSEWRALITRIQEITLEEAGIPMVYGIDSVHGAIYVANATLFGQQINGAATFNPDLVYEMGRVTGKDTEAAGIPWVFGPILDISQNPLWARTFETFGEDPYLASVMADSVIRGLQSNNQTAACMKHFVGYSKTPTGHDRDGVSMSDYDLLNYFVPSFKAGIAAGAMSTMENYISINGIPVVANSKILLDLIRADLVFDGVVVTDWAEINNLKDWHRVVDTYEEAVRLALSHTSLDMSMVPYTSTFIDYAKTMLDSFPEYEDRVRESAKRVIKMKLKLGLYDTPVPGKANVASVGSADDVASALEMARESIVLLKNTDGILPLAKDASVFLTGHSADNVGYQCGGWSVRWQGYSGNDMFPHGISVKEGMESIAGNGSFTYFNGLNADGTYTAADLATAKQYAAKAEYTIAIIGEASYAEKPGDIDDLALPAGQIEYVTELAATGTKVILVLFEGRPRLLGTLPDTVDAVVHGLLACEQGGQAMAEILYGKVNPSGRLPITYPKDEANIMIPYNHRVSTQCSSGYCEMQWDFGTGLSYTTFTYSSLKLSKSTVTGPSDSLTVSVVVTNSGSVAGKETVMLFVIQPYRTISVPEVKMLRKFQKISLSPGVSKKVTFTLTADDWSVYDPQIGNGFNQVAEDGQFVVAIKPETECDVYNTITDSMCAAFTLSTGVTTFGLNDSSVVTVDSFSRK